MKVESEINRISKKYLFKYGESIHYTEIDELEDEDIIKSLQLLNINYSRNSKINYLILNIIIITTYILFSYSVLLKTDESDLKIMLFEYTIPCIAVVSFLFREIYNSFIEILKYDDISEKINDECSGGACLEYKDIQSIIYISRYNFVTIPAIIYQILDIFNIEKLKKLKKFSFDFKQNKLNKDANFVLLKYNIIDKIRKFLDKEDECELFGSVGLGVIYNKDIDIYIKSKKDKSLIMKYICNEVFNTYPQNITCCKQSDDNWTYTIQKINGYKYMWKVDIFISSDLINNSYEEFKYIKSIMKKEDKKTILKLKKQVDKSNDENMIKNSNGFHIYSFVLNKNGKNLEGYRNYLKNESKNTFSKEAIF